MTQLISNVLMQPKLDAVERPLPLVEKLEQELSANCRLNNWDLGFQAAIDIVKQHSEWISVDERLPSDWSVVLCYGVPFEWDKTSKPNSNIFCAVYVAEYDRWSVGYSAFGDTSTQKITHWMPLPQPPSEVQEKIYQQEMDKIKFCACGCILSDGLTQCSDCEALDDM